MNPYQPSATADDTAPDVGDVELRNPVITKLFSFVPMFLAIRGGLWLSSIYAPGKSEGFAMDHVATGFAAWAISALASFAFAMAYLGTLRQFIAKRADHPNRTYDIFGVALLGLCVTVIVLPPIVFR